MRRKKTIVEQHAIPAEPLSEQPIAIAPAPDWRYSPTPPIFDGDTGERITGGVAEDWRRDDPSLPWLIIRCEYGCRDLIATRNPRRDICERCERCAYRIRDEFYERQRTQIRRNTGRLLNPFASTNIFNEGASLPSPGGPRRR